MLDEKKKKRLTEIARLYYENDKNQSEIAQIYNISRPMVSKLLAEAREVGIVSITINELKSHREILAEKIAAHFSLSGVSVIEYTRKDEEEDKLTLLKAVWDIIGESEEISLGVGCGSTLGTLSEALEISEEKPLLNGEVCPLIGGFKATFKSYHTNELVRVISENTGLKAGYVYLPALLSSQDEKELYKASELYKQSLVMWNKISMALINISSLYAPPDLATSARFGKKLASEKAVGRFLAHYYDIDGNFITALEDNVMQIEIEDLKNVEEVVALCSQTVDANAVIGALRTGLFTKIIISEQLAEDIIRAM